MWVEKGNTLEQNLLLNNKYSFNIYNHLFTYLYYP